MRWIGTNEFRSKTYLRELANIWREVISNKDKSVTKKKNVSYNLLKAYKKSIIFTYKRGKQGISLILRCYYYQQGKPPKKSHQE